jgi:hypothetical protein
VLLSSWLLFVGRDHPRLLLGRAQRPTAPAAASSVLQLHVADCKDDEITAASAGILYSYTRTFLFSRVFLLLAMTTRSRHCQTLSERLV